MEENAKVLAPPRLGCPVIKRPPPTQIPVKTWPRPKDISCGPPLGWGCSGLSGPAHQPRVERLHSLVPAANAAQCGNCTTDGFSGQALRKSDSTNASVWLASYALRTWIASLLSRQSVSRHQGAGEFEEAVCRKGIP